MTDKEIEIRVEALYEMFNSLQNNVNLTLTVFLTTLGLAIALAGWA